MTGWSMFWAMLVAGGVLAFAVLAMVVAICGVRDVRMMFERIDHQHRQPESGDTDTPH